MAITVSYAVSSAQNGPVDKIQKLTHRVTRYNVKELRNGPWRKGPSSKRQHAAKLLRDWRRAKMASPDAHESEKTTADVF